MPDTLSRRNLRCSAIWNGCKCDRYPHEGNGHVWRNTLDGDLVDPALYPSAAHIDALTAAPLDEERLTAALHRVGHVLNGEGSCDNVEGDDCLGPEWHRRDAADIAREYARV